MQRITYWIHLRSGDSLPHDDFGEFLEQLTWFPSAAIRDYAVSWTPALP